jgi:predicted molibdopterin-dependent oxidoreductase YjgC
MKRTFEQGVNAYKAGVKLEEVKAEVLADFEIHSKWVMGWLSAQGKWLEEKQIEHSKFLDKHENRFAEYLKRIERYELENVQLKMQLKEVLSIQVVH